MTKKLQYRLELGVSDSADVDDVEDFLQQVLLDMYEQGQVESIKVTKNGEKSEGVDEPAASIPNIVNVVERVDSSDVKLAIDSVQELENIGGSNDG